MSNSVIYILVVIVGLAVGSFLNVVVLRFDDFKSILKTRSRCPKCKKEIAWYDLIPFLSYVYLGGKCRNCKKTISLQYPIVEGLTGLVFALIYWKFGITVSGALAAVVASLLIAISAYDIIEYKIPDILSYIAILASLAFVLLNLYQIHGLTAESFRAYLYAVLASGGFLALLVIVSREKWMGAGDIALGAIMGLMLGWPDVFAGMFIAFVSGSLVGIALMGLRKKELKDAVPFGPFLAFGILFALLYGDQIASWYLNRFY